MTAQATVRKKKKANTAEEKTRLIPESWVMALKRFCIRSVGVVLILIFIATLISLISYHGDDPSWNNSHTGDVQNWLGIPGATLSDLLLQFFGAVAPLALLPLASHGFHIASLHGRGPWKRQSLAWLACLPFLTCALASIPNLADWPVDAGAGGTLGLLCLRWLNEGFAYFNLITPWWAITLGTGLIGVLGFTFGLGLNITQWRACFHFLYQCSVAISRFIWSIFAFFFISPIRRRQDSDDAVDYDDIDEDTVTAPKKKRRWGGTKRTKKPVDVKLPKSNKGGKLGKQNKEPRLPLGDGFELPSLSLLSPAPAQERDPTLAKDALEANARMLEGVLQDFSIKGEIVNVRPGPVVTLYELEPAPGIKSSRIIGLADDIARSMSAVSARIAVIPGRNAIGIELPNAQRQTVYLRELLDSKAFDRAKGFLPIVLGKTIGGEPIITDLTLMPHLLVAGATGAGKSVGLNAIILSLLYRLTPDQCRFIMIDPKMVELSVYDGIPHLLTPVVIDPKKAVVALKWAVRQMEERNKQFVELGVRNIKSFNDKIAAFKGKPVVQSVQTGFDNETGAPIYEDKEFEFKKLPHIVVIIDELADLMIVAGKDIEGSIYRLAQVARAAGIHIIIATQRPSVDVITGVIKANLPTRISFQVTSKIDSRTILDGQGAEQLLGRGDMLLMQNGKRLTRVHGPFVSDAEVEAVVRHLKTQGRPDYLHDVTEGGDDDDSSSQSAGGETSPEDEIYDRAVALVGREGKASTSFIQRHLQIGYNRAARIIERMEKEGVVGPANHVGKREVLIGEQ